MQYVMEMKFSYDKTGELVGIGITGDNYSGIPDKIQISHDQNYRYIVQKLLREERSDKYNLKD